MKFSGHETFHVRENWLSKGLRLLKDSPEQFHDKYMHDWLGVGSNMGKSIKHWLVVTDLAEPDPETRGVIQLSPLGSLIFKKDPYMLDPFTWWILHINLVHEEAKATSWHWFFNNYHQAQFKKEQCVLRLMQFLESKAIKIPSYQTIERDVSCLISGYSLAIPNAADPEENYTSPFADLGLISHFTETGSYHLNIGSKNIPACALGYSLSRVFGEGSAKSSDVSLDEAITTENGPGKCFVMRASELFDLVEIAERESPESGISISALAGKRTIRFDTCSPIEWVNKHFFSI